MAKSPKCVAAMNAEAFTERLIKRIPKWVRFHAEDESEDTIKMLAEAAKDFVVSVIGKNVSFDDARVMYIALNAAADMYDKRSLDQETTRFAQVAPNRLTSNFIAQLQLEGRV